MGRHYYTISLTNITRQPTNTSMSAMSFQSNRYLTSSLQIDLNDMTQEEIADFEKVMNRIDAINELEANRIRRLKTLIMSQEKAKLSTVNLNNKTLKNLLCHSCGSYGLSSKIAIGKSSIRPSILCRICQLPVCHSCWRSAVDKKLKICPSCHKKLVLDAKSGNWFHQQMKKRLSVDRSSEFSRVSPNPVKEITQSHSPKRKLLHRLRSYNSVHEELDEMENILTTHSPASNWKFQISDQPEYSQKRAGHSPSFYINSELESEEEVKLDLSDDIVNSNKNYYRPLSHISNQPLKSCSNGSPIPLEDHTTDICKSVHDANSMQNPISSPGGEVLIELDFNFRMSQFIIILRQCRNLPQIDAINNIICPYLFVLLLPDRSKKSRRTTSVKKNCFCPIFDQIFKYSINFAELESRSILVMLCHKDDLSSRDLALGQVIIPLSFVDFSRPIVRWYSFQLLIEPNLNQSRIDRSFSSAQTRNSNIPAYFGEISLAIKHVPKVYSITANANHSDSFGELYVWVKSMRNVAQHQLNSNICVAPSRRFSTSDDKGITESKIIDNISFGSSKLLSAIAQFGQNQPVARVCLLPYRTSMQSTSPAKSQSENSSQYVWSTILKFTNVDIEELRTRSLEVTIWVNSKHGWLNRIIHPRCVGGVRLCRGGRDCQASPRQGNQCRGASTGMIEEKMWAAMLDRSNTWVDGTIKLKMDSSFLNMNVPEF